MSAHPSKIIQLLLKKLMQNVNPVAYPIHNTTCQTLTLLRLTLYFKHFGIQILNYEYFGAFEHHTMVET